ncbi:MAG: HDOD domain-containing protein [Terracidiphilus sp.]|nr:HDOD domain-containing protein [Terracidiphilus sp.]MDR3798080.1 HDOD domain-containing protein [Terracidiphilus sp.]
MSTAASVSEGSKAGGPGAAASIRYVARQPIMDLRGKVHAYELLWRNGPNVAFFGDGERASRTMIDNTLLFGLARLTGGLPAFINCTENILTSDLINLLPSSTTVLEVLETVEPSDTVVQACHALKIAGYKLALDDFVWIPGIERLVELADYIKVDFLISGEPQRQELLHRLRGTTVTLLAEKVETQEEYLKARDEGFTLMQGYYFCRPVLMENREVPSNRLSQLEILRLLQDETVDPYQLALQVRQDVSLTYRLLRLANSPVWSYQQEVHSVRDALIVVGEVNFRRLAAVAIASELNAGQPPELLRMAFVRARFCELAAGFCGLNRTEQYLMGMLSLLPAMLRVPMKDLSPSLPFSDEIRQALEGKHVPERALLSWLEGHEQGNWAACDKVVETQGLNPHDLLLRFEEALQWAEDSLHFA